MRESCEINLEKKGIMSHYVSLCFKCCINSSEFFRDLSKYDLHFQIY